MAGFWGSGYWHANYWHPDYWGEYVAVSVDGQYWHANYWHANYWATGYWALASNTQLISQTSAPQLFLTEFVTGIQIDVDVRPGTPNLPFATFQADAANDVTVSATLATLSLTGIDTTYDAGESYEGDISLVVYASSNFSFSYVVTAGLGSLALTPINPGVTGGTGDVLVSVTSTPALTLTALPVSAANPVTVQPGTPSLGFTAFNVTTGFGTLVSTGIGSLTLQSPQANVFGTNANINEFPATLATMTLTTYSPSVIAATDVEEEQNSGGYGAYNWYQSYKQRKRRREKKLKELSEALETIEDAVDREIAEILHSDDEEAAIQESINDLKRQIDLHFSEQVVADAISENVGKALVRAATQRNFSAVQAFEREMELAIEEEELLLLVMVNYG